MSLDPVVALPRLRMATLPTALERGPQLPGGAQLWVKRDDLTGLGLGGNKARKLEFLCAAAVASGAQALVTVGAAQSNHCRVTAAAGAVLGLETHLVLSGGEPAELTGNQLLAARFGAQLHHTGAEAHHWGALEIAREHLTEALAEDGVRAYSIPIGGSTPVGALGYLAAFAELMDQCDGLGIAPRAVVFASSSGGTHAGLVAGRAWWRSLGRTAPDVVAIGVAKGVNAGMPDIAAMAAAALAAAGLAGAAVDEGDVEIDTRWIGVDYGVPTEEADAAIAWAARSGAWVLDRVYTGKGFAGLLGLATDGRWAGGDDVVMIHTGGIPSVFAPGGSPR
jgi:1-aminocyclopropane-1-carboxylate deaminase/D-cysteine desulfhydrase-like pyridoxal-dependent ACC family enzyme